MCARYFEGRTNIIRHLGRCVNPLKRLEHRRYDFPKHLDGRPICVICGFTPKDFKAMIEHILRKHESDMIQLDAWGYDYDLISAQFERWTNGVEQMPPKRSQMSRKYK